MTLGWLAIAGTSFAAQPLAAPSASEILQGIRRLSSTGTVLYVAAHPDDENTRLLAYFANDLHLRAGYLSLTRGEGGQNLIGSEKGPLLGMIRTQELLAARRTDGAEQFFTRARDFGYSKSVDETLAIWGRDDVLADVVWVLRSLQPDVVITRFPLEAGETHGHHTASARLAVEAFRAAADPAFHPEQLQHVGVWQAKRIVWNEWSREPKEKPTSAPMSLDAGGYNPLLGRSYGEIAAQSRSMHKSQGFGAAPTRGPGPEAFRLLAGTPGKSLFEGVDLGWTRVEGTQKLRTLLQQVEHDFRVDAPAASIPLLLTVLDELRKLPPSALRARKEHELSELIGGCAGLFLEAKASGHLVTPGSSLDVAITALNRSGAALDLKEIRLSGAPPQALGRGLGFNRAVTEKAVLTVPADARLTQPYWLDAPPTRGTWQVADPALISLPELPSALQAVFVLASQGRTFELTRPVNFLWTDPTAGERAREVEIVGPVSVNPETSLLMFPDAAPRQLHVSVQGNVDHVVGKLVPQVPRGWRAEPTEMPFTLGARGLASEFAFRIRPPRDGAGADASGSLRVAAEVNGQRWDRGLARIEYPHLPIQTLQPRADVQLQRVDLTRGPRTRLGYIPGSGDDVAMALRQVGYDVTVLDDEALRAKPLSPYAAIVVGIRAFNTNPHLPAYHDRLMKYVSDGGTLLVQYNTKNWVSSVPAELGPYPFEISQDRVTDETASIELDPVAKGLWTSPNKLSAADFEGWVQERGLYFASKWDPHYQTPFSLHDPGEPASRGSVLIGKYGQGVFIYTGLAFFRQLPAGVPGAYRLFANLLAHGH